MNFESRKSPQDYISDLISSDRGYVTGILTGLVAGVAIGLLFAPKSGKKLRRQIAKATGDQADGLQKTWRKTTARTRETLADAKDSVQDKVKTYSHDAEDKANSLIDGLKSGIDKAKNSLHIG
ncbi:YtxH domain-containing protein [Fibrella sp. WM1]|uniref:YtxH domain-containing protein n=1 Tax=Fibrella musci TaxID=3242485 RepID=UPI003520745C